MSLIIVERISSELSTSPLTLYTGNPLGPSIVIQAANTDINLVGDVKSKSVSGNAAGNLLKDIIVYNLALG